MNYTKTFFSPFSAFETDEYVVDRKRAKRVSIFKHSLLCIYICINDGTT